MTEITWGMIYHECENIYRKITNKGQKYDYIYPIMRGGAVIAAILSERLHVPIIDTVNNIVGRILIVDDVYDSGKTLDIWTRNGFDTATLYIKDSTRRLPTYYGKKKHGWLHFPWEKKGESIQDNITRILQSIGEDPRRVGILETPDRVAKMYREIFKGYDVKQKPNVTVFPNGQDGVSVNQMIVDSGSYVSWCEHHMLPFFGQYHFAYIPNGSIVGLSKIARIVEWHASRLQVQERLVAQIAEDLDKALNPQGLALMLKGRHLCKEIRGAKNKGEMVTTELKGVFMEQEVRMEFLHIIGGAR